MGRKTGGPCWIGSAQKGQQRPRSKTKNKNNKPPEKRFFVKSKQKSYSPPSPAKRRTTWILLSLKKTSRGDISQRNHATLPEPRPRARNSGAQAGLIPSKRLAQHPAMLLQDGPQPVHQEDRVRVHLRRSSLALARKMRGGGWGGRRWVLACFCRDFQKESVGICFVILLCVSSQQEERS